MTARNPRGMDAVVLFYSLAVISWVLALSGGWGWAGLGAVFFILALNEDRKDHRASKEIEAFLRQPAQPKPVEPTPEPDPPVINVSDRLTTYVDRPEPIKKEPRVWTKDDLIEHFGEDAPISLGRGREFKVRDLNGG